MTSLRHQALSVLLECNPAAKAARARAATHDLPAEATVRWPAVDGIPGRPDRPELVPHARLRSRSVATREGRAALIHALCHIEFNAIDLAADAAWRFPDMPHAYYDDWTRVMREEALHFGLLCDHLATLGATYGDLPAHNALWEMAERTRHDVLARVALVPRTLEARGLDASPAVRARLLGAGDAAGAAIIDVILRDEIEHVRIGNRWFRWLCDARGLDPVATYVQLARTHQAPRPRGPFNLDARRAAGFEPDELAALGES